MRPWAAFAAVVVAVVAVAWATQRRRYPLAPAPLVAVPPQW